MKVNVDSSFLKDFKKIEDKVIKSKVLILLKEIENLNSFNEITNIKKIKGYSNLYRIAFYKYRIGFKIDKNEITFLKIMLRKDIYRYFP